jgi:type IX secretion system PorP/SprF family membrane protein
VRKKVNFVGFLFFLMLQHCSLAQISFSFPDYFDQFYNNYYLLNTANSDTTYKIAAMASNKAQTGLFQGVNKLYMDIDLRIPSRNRIFHFVGIQAINNREGDFINKNRFLGRYSSHIKISERASLSAGISIGFVNYAFNTSQSGTGGSDWAPDGNGGIWYLRKKLSIGLSAQQVFNQKIRPVGQTFSLDNYYNLTARYSITISPFVTLNTHFYSKWQKIQPEYFALASLFEVQEKFDAGVSYNYRRGLSAVAGIKRLGIGRSRFSFYFSYFVGTSKIKVSDNAFELFLSFHR